MTTRREAQAQAAEYLARAKGALVAASTLLAMVGDTGQADALDSIATAVQREQQALQGALS